MYLFCISPSLWTLKGGGIPIGNCGSLLLAFIPHARTKHEYRLARCLEDTQQSTNGDQSREIMTSSMQRQHRSPETHIDPEILSNRHPLYHPVGRILNYQHSDVDTRREPGVLLSLQVRLLADAHDRGKGHGAFVEGLQEVGNDHDYQDAAVDEGA